MMILIDGYNVLKQIYGGQMISAQMRAQFVKQLQQYAQKKGHQIMVAFDGGTSTWPSREQKGPILIVYAGMHNSADDVIKEQVTLNPDKEFIVVTSDRELAQFVASPEVQILKAQEFYTFLQENFNQKKKQRAGLPFIKTGESKQADIDALMKQASEEKYYKTDEEIRVQKRVGQSKKLSKENRRRLRVLKKL